MQHVTLLQGIIIIHFSLSLDLIAMSPDFIIVLVLTDLGTSAVTPHCCCQSEAFIIWHQADVGSHIELGLVWNTYAVPSTDLHTVQPGKLSTVNCYS